MPRVSIRSALLLSLTLSLAVACGGSTTDTGNGNPVNGPTCSDGIKNGAETGVDCGGGTCAACTAGTACVVNADCTTGLCSANVCRAAPTCNDGVKNGAETDIDCGGGTCGACSANKACLANADCGSSLCSGNVCQAPISCSDGTKNGAETGVDCGGGTCAACTAGTACIVNADCTTGFCSGNVCRAAPTCNDGVKNGAETDIDCGGGTCGACSAGKTCSVNTDCAGGAACAAGTCGAPVSLAVSATPYGTTHARVRFAASNFTPGTFTLYRSTAVGTTGTAVATPAGTAQEYMDSGLSVGTTYYYKVAASGPQATVSSPQAKATTEAAAAFTAKPTGFLTTWVPPANPRELGYVHLQWDAYPGANIYEVYRTPVAELVGDQQFTKLLGIPTATSFDDGAVVKGVVYHYFVIAHDTIGGRVSAPAAISVGAPGMPLFCEAPIVDTVSSSPDVHYAHLYFWGGAGATEHHVYVSTDPAVITPVQGGTGAPLDGAPNSLAITEVRPGYFRMNIPWATLASYGVGATVHVAVEGWRVTANSHAPSTGHASFVVQDVPSVNISDLIATRLNPHAVQLSWTAPAIIGLSGYDIYRLATPTEAPSGANLLATQGSTGFTDTTASPGTYYYYQVFAKKSRLAFPSNVAAVKTFSDWAPLLLPPYSFAFTGVAYLGWSSFNDGTTFRVYGGTALLDNPDFIGNLASLVGVTLSPQPPVATFVDFGMTVGGAEITIPSADLDATRLSLFSMRLFGQWWVSEVYPDGTESAKAATIPILIF